MPITINDGFKTNAPRATDMRSGKLVSGKSVPYETLAEALVSVPIAYRYVGLTVNVAGEEYWFKAGLTDEDLVFKVNIAEVADFLPPQEGNNGKVLVTDGEQPHWADNSAMQIVPEILLFTGDGSYDIPEDSMIVKIIVSPEDDTSLAISNTPGAADLLSIVEITGGMHEPISRDIPAIGSVRTIYFENIVSPTVIRIYRWSTGTPSSS